MTRGQEESAEAVVLMNTVSILSSMICGCAVVPTVRSGGLVLRHEDGCRWLAAIERSEP